MNILTKASMMEEVAKICSKLTLLEDMQQVPTEDVTDEVAGILGAICNIDAKLSTIILTLHTANIDAKASKSMIEEAINQLNELKSELV